MFYQHANDNDHTTGINTFLWSHSLLWKLRWRTKLDGSKIQSCIWSCQWPCLEVGSWIATLSHQTVLSQSVDLKLYCFICQSYSSVWAWRATLSISPDSFVQKCGLEVTLFHLSQSIVFQYVGLKSHTIYLTRQFCPKVWARSHTISLSQSIVLQYVGLKSPPFYLAYNVSKCGFEVIPSTSPVTVNYAWKCGLGAILYFELTSWSGPKVWLWRAVLSNLTCWSHPKA